MRRLVIAAVVALVIGCHSPLPGPTPLPSAVPILEGWLPTCSDVPEPACSGVAALFALNLGRTSRRVQVDSGGVITVTARPECPPMPDWMVPGMCWQASAETLHGRICMVVAEQGPSVPADSRFGYGQVGGDVFGVVGEPAEEWPMCV